jgi:hypothetical protein
VGFTLVLAVCGAERGCLEESNVVGWLLIAFLVVGAVVGVAGWAWYRWERGPFSILARRSRGRRRGD